MTTLTQDDHELLRRTVAERNSDLLPLLSQIDRRPLTSDEREELRGVLVEELTAAGLGPGDEPTDYGLQLEALIDALGHC
jgi:hypothetical protein